MKSWIPILTGALPLALLAGAVTWLGAGLAGRLAAVPIILPLLAAGLAYALLRIGHSQGAAWAPWALLGLAAALGVVLGRLSPEGALPPLAVGLAGGLLAAGLILGLKLRGRLPGFRHLWLGAWLYLLGWLALWLLAAGPDPRRAWAAGGLALFTALTALWASSITGHGGLALARSPRSTPGGSHGEPGLLDLGGQGRSFPGWNADLLAWAADLYLLGLNLVLAAAALLAPG